MMTHRAALLTRRALALAAGGGGRVTGGVAGATDNPMIDYQPQENESWPLQLRNS